MEPHLLSLPQITSTFCRHTYIDARPYAPLRPFRSHSSDNSHLSVDSPHKVMLSVSLNAPSPPLYRWRSELNPSLPHSYKQTRDRLRQMFLSSFVRPGEESGDFQSQQQHNLPGPLPTRTISTIQGRELRPQLPATTKLLRLDLKQRFEKSTAQSDSSKKKFENTDFPFILDDSFQSNWIAPALTLPPKENRLTKFRLFSMSIPDANHVVSDLSHSSHLFPCFNKPNLHARRYKVQEHTPCHFSQIELEKMDAPELKTLPNFYPSCWNNRLVYLHGRRKPIDITSNELYLIGRSKYHFDQSQFLSVSMPCISPSSPVDPLTVIPTFKSSSCSNFDPLHLRVPNNSEYINYTASPPPSSTGSDQFVFTRANSHESTHSPAFSFSKIEHTPENFSNHSPSSKIRSRPPKYPLNICPSSESSSSESHPKYASHPNTKPPSNRASRSTIRPSSSTTEFHSNNASLIQSRLSNIEVFSDNTKCVQHPTSNTDVKYNTSNTDVKYNTSNTDIKFNTSNTDVKYNTSNTDVKYKTSNTDVKYNTSNTDVKYNTSNTDVKYNHNDDALPPVLQSLSSDINLISKESNFISPPPPKQVNMNPLVHVPDTPYSKDPDEGDDLLGEVIKNQEKHVKHLTNKRSLPSSSLNKGERNLVFKEVPVKWRVSTNPLVEDNTSSVNNQEVIYSKVSQSLRGFPIPEDYDAKNTDGGNTAGNASSPEESGNCNPITPEFIENLIDELVFGIDFYNMANRGESGESRNSSKHRSYSSSRNRERERMSRQLHRHQTSSCARRLNVIREQRRENLKIQLAMKQSEKINQRRKRLSADGLENLFNITHAYTFSYYPTGYNDCMLVSCGEIDGEAGSVIR